MWTMSRVKSNTKKSEINCFKSCEMSFSMLRQPQAADSADTAGSDDLRAELLFSGQIPPLHDWVACRPEGLRREKSKDKEVACRLLTHLEQPQVHFHFGSFSGQTHKNWIIGVTNEKLKVRNRIRTRGGSWLTSRNLYLFLSLVGLVGIKDEELLCIFC